jgi:murein DD-endopeptidase MepM/ murein hydrolase activator NlpD
MYRQDSGFARHRADGPDHHSDRAARSRRNGKVATLCTIVLLASWAGAATLYILFRDDALKAIVARQIAITRSYESQATQLHTEIDRLRSLKLIDQERVERALAELTRRQNTLEARQSALPTVGARPSSREATAEITGAIPAPRMPSPASAPKPSPLSDTILVVPPSDRTARLESRPLPPLGSRTDFGQIESATDVRVGNLARELEQLEVAQNRALNEAEETYDGRERRMRRAFADLGLKTARSRGTAKAASGGPFLPWSRPPEDPFARQLYRIRLAARAVEALQRELATVPVIRPTTGATDVTSPFGVRLDPFVRQLALHTGVDFRGEPGEPVRAAASGKVAQAERNGGYGLMVEVDHGNGITTRYAHLSAILVSEGSIVDAGTVIGRIGTTGRSTGPHLHYEVRVNGEAVDPQRFLRAGLGLDAIQ